MKSIIFTGILAISPIMTVVADGAPEYVAPKDNHAEMQPSIPIKPIYEHRVNFGLFNLGYERIALDSIYTGFEAKIGSFLANEKNKNNVLNNYVSGEVRLGYNHSLGEVDNVAGYGGIGFSLFSIEKEQGKLRNWNYGTIGVKYLHQFGEIFEMGLHFKGHMSISQKRYVSEKIEKKPEIKKLESPEGSILPIAAIKFANQDTETNLTAVKVTDSRFVIQMGLPMIWHIGAQKNWEIQFEPYYMQIPNKKLAHIIGSNIAVGYRY